MAEELSSGLLIEPVKLKRRERSIYLRPMTIEGETMMVRTDLLPSDPMARQAYLARGFRLADKAAKTSSAEREVTERDAIIEKQKKALDDALALIAELKAKVEERDVVDEGIKCPHCEAKVKNEAGLAIHIGAKHKK